MAEKINLEDVTSDDLIAELQERGVDLHEDCNDITEFSADDLRSELDRRSEFSGDLAEILGDHKLFAWLRDSNPPQEVRDAYWSAYGRIL